MTIENRPYNPIAYFPYDINNDGGEYTKEAIILERILNAYASPRENLTGDELRQEQYRTARENIRSILDKAETPEVGFDNFIHQNFYYITLYTTADDLIEGVGKHYGDSLAIHRIEFREFVRVMRDFLNGEFL